MAEPALLGLLDELSESLDLLGGRVHSFLREAAEYEVLVVADLDRGENRDAERAAELLGRVDHPRRLTRVALRNGVEPRRIVDREHDPEADALQHESRDE